jgi:hypothetical protein
MENLEVRPHPNANDLCLVCHRKLVVRRPTDEEKVMNAKLLNEKFKLSLVPSDIVMMANECVCGQSMQVFWKNFEQEWKDLV